MAASLDALRPPPVAATGCWPSVQSKCTICTLALASTKRDRVKPERLADNMIYGQITHIIFALSSARPHLGLLRLRSPRPARRRGVPRRLQREREGE